MGKTKGRGGGEREVSRLLLCSTLRPIAPVRRIAPAHPRVPHRCSLDATHPRLPRPRRCDSRHTAQRVHEEPVTVWHGHNTCQRAASSDASSLPPGNQPARAARGTQSDGD